MYNLLQLGTIIDPRRYREGIDQELWDDNHHIIAEEKTDYEKAKEYAKETRSWVLEHFELHLDGANDGMDATTRLQELSDRFLVQQSKALVLHKVKAEALNIDAEDDIITAVAIREAIEDDFATDEDFMRFWPPRLAQEKGQRGASKVKQHLHRWLAEWRDTCTSYAWPTAPEGGRYFMKAIH